MEILNIYIILISLYDKNKSILLAIMLYDYLVY